METRKLEFTEQQMKNMAIFLNRVQTTGLQEAAALVEIAQVINKPLLDMIKPNDDNQGTEQTKAPVTPPVEEGKS